MATCPLQSAENRLTEPVQLRDTQPWRHECLRVIFSTAPMSCVPLRSHSSGGGRWCLLIQAAGLLMSHIGSMASGTARLSLAEGASALSRRVEFDRAEVRELLSSLGVDDEGQS